MGREIGRERSRDRGRDRSRSRDRGERRRSRSRDRGSRRSRSRDKRGSAASYGIPAAYGTPESNPQMQAAMQHAAVQQQQAEIQRQQMLQSLALAQQALASIPGVTIGGINATPGSSSAPNPATKKGREIYIGNLAQGVITSDLIREMFNSALANFVPDPVTNPPIMEIRMDTTGRYCFVETRTLELAGHLIELDKIEVCGRQLKIGRPKGYEEEAVKLLQQQKLNMAQTFAAQLSGAATNVVLLENLVPAKNILDPSERREIYDDVFAEAAKCGPVAGVAVPVPAADISESEPCRVYVKYHSVDDSKRCKEMMDGRSFDDRIVKVSFSNDYDFTRAQQGEWVSAVGAIQQVSLPQLPALQMPTLMPSVPSLTGAITGLPPGVTIPLLKPFEYGS